MFNLFALKLDKPTQFYLKFMGNRQLSFVRIYNIFLKVFSEMFLFQKKTNFFMNLEFVRDL